MFIILPAIPKVPLMVLGTLVKKDQFTADIPRIVTYPTITARIRIEIEAQK